MTNEQILEKQVEALEKLLQLRAAVIEELEAKIAKNNNTTVISTPWSGPYVPYQPISHFPWIGGAGAAQGSGSGVLGGAGGIISSNVCPDGTPHNWPSSQMGTAHCTKCGQALGISNSIVVTNVNAQTSGYIQPIDPSDANVYTLTNIAK